MPRTKSNFALIENETERKISYQKREKGFFKKAHELSILCGVEIATVIYSPYSNEPKVCPNQGEAINTFTKFRELPTLEKSKNMVTREEFTNKRLKKMEKKLYKLRKENRAKEITNEMYEVLKGKDISADMQPSDFNDLSFVIKKNLEHIHKVMKKKADDEGSTSNAPQIIFGSMVLSGINSEEPRAPLLAPTGAPVSVVPLVSLSKVPSGTNIEGPRAPQLFPNVDTIWQAPPIVPLSASLEVPQQMFNLATPLRNPPQTIPLVDQSCVLPSHLFFSHMFPPMVPQLFSPMPQQMSIRRSPSMAPHMPSTMMSSPMPSPMMDPPLPAPVSHSVTPQMDPSMDISTMDVSMPIYNYQNDFTDFPQSPSLSALLNWNDHDVVTLLEDPSLNNSNVQDPNHNNNL